VLCFAYTFAYNYQFQQEFRAQGYKIGLKMMAWSQNIQLAPKISLYPAHPA
jgi:hypothetical protein